MRPKSLILLALALACGLVAAIGINQVMANRSQQRRTNGTPSDWPEAMLIIAGAHRAGKY